MSIATQIENLTAKVSTLSGVHDDIITAINSKGVSATGHGFEDFADDIEAIDQSGTHSPVISVADTGVVSASCGGVTNTHTLSASDDADFVAGNIKLGVTVFGVTGTHQGAGTYESKTVTPNAAGQTVYPDTGYDALSSVVINGDADLVAGNIKKDVDIFGVTGTFEGGELEAKTVTPSASSQTVTPSSGNYGLSSVTVNGDTDLVAGNIKKDVEIFGVTGTFVGGDLESKTVTPSSSSQTVTPSSGKYGLSSVIVNGDGDLAASNIKKDVEIFGVTGTYEGTQIAGSGGLSYSESSNSTGITVNIVSTSGGYGYSYAESAYGSGTQAVMSCVGTEIGPTTSLVIVTLSTKINRVIAVYGSYYVSGYVSNNIGYVNIPGSYTGTVTVRGYSDSALLNSATVSITGINKYECSIEV